MGFLSAPGFRRTDRGTPASRIRATLSLASGIVNALDWGMILDLLTYLTTPCSPDVRRLGYLRESIATRARFKRQQHAWAPHLENSRRMIEQAVRRSGGGDTVVVFGGGLAHDLPLEALSEAFQRVQLVDVVHLRSTKALFRGLGNVEAISHDVTESMASVRAGRPVAAEPRRFLDDATVDLVISANVLSQLPIMPGAYLERWRGLGEVEIERFSADLVQAHLDYLDRFDCPVCLITDVTREIFDARGDAVTTISALWEVELPWLGGEWEWQIEPLSEGDPDHSVVNQVCGIVDIARAERAE
jgi:hypothetical protein